MIAPQLRRVSILLSLSLLLVPAARAAGPDSVETVEKAATEWVKTRAETVRLETEWTSQCDLLKSMVQALTARAQTLEDKRDNLRARTAGDRDELAALAAKNQAEDKELQSAASRLKGLDERLEALRPMLPPRLSAALDLPYRSLAKPDLDPGERMQLTMTVLNRCVQFNHVVTCGEEVLDIPGEGGPRALQTIYWGLSHAYALDVVGAKAWYGSPGAQGWQWNACPEAAKQVARLIAIHNDKFEPDFVAVPIRLGHLSAAAANP
jgi:hypothetical protein